MPSGQAPWYLGNLAPSPLASWLYQEPSPWHPWHPEIPEMRHVHHAFPLSFPLRPSHFILMLSHHATLPNCLPSSYSMDPTVAPQELAEASQDLNPDRNYPVMYNAD